MLLIKSRMHQLGQPSRPLTAWEVAERSGGLISAKTVSQVTRGKPVNLTDADTLALAGALEIDSVLIERAISESR